MSAAHCSLSICVHEPSSFLPASMVDCANSPTEVRQTTQLESARRTEEPLLVCDTRAAGGLTLMVAPVLKPLSTGTSAVTFISIVQPSIAASEPNGLEMSYLLLVLCLVVLGCPSACTH